MITNRLIGSILLISGTCVGAGMLALPVVSAPAGFLPATALLFACWFVMYLSGLLVVEVNLWLPQESSFIGMAGRIFGVPGRVIAWIFYLLLLYSLIAAYLTGGGDLLGAAVNALFSVSLSSWITPLLWFLVVGYFVYAGTQRVDQLNRLLIIGLLVTFALLLFLLLAHVDIGSTPLFKRSQPGKLFYALPVVNAAFGFHVVLPSVRNYLNSDVKQLTRAVFWGSFIPFIIYLLWQIGIFSVIPFAGKHGLYAILLGGRDPATDLSHAILLIKHNKWLAITMDFFVFFALATSFIAIALSLFDLLADGLHIKKTPMGRFKLALLTLLPPYFYAGFYRQGFILALSYAGVFVAALGILLPTIMVWVGRLRRLGKGGYRTPGGWLTLLSMAVAALLIVFAYFWAAL